MLTAQLHIVRLVLSLSLRLGALRMDGARFAVVAGRARRSWRVPLMMLGDPSLESVVTRWLFTRAVVRHALSETTVTRRAMFDQQIRDRPLVRSAARYARVGRKAPR